MTASQTAPVSSEAAEQGQHYELIRAAITPVLATATASFRTALRQTKPDIPAWYAAATQAQKDQLQTYVDASLKSRAEFEKTMHKVQDADTFGQPLLEAALKSAGYEVDVHQVWVRLYVPIEESFGVKTGHRVKTLSLMQAALNNFEAEEAQAGFFDNVSGFITAPDARGHFERYTTTLNIETFARLCRDLDLGQQYQDHLAAYLRPLGTVSKNLLRARFITHHKDAFTAAAYMALLKGDISADDHLLLMRVAQDERRIKVGSKQVWYRWPSMMGLALHGCVIFDPSEEHRYGTWFIAYIPDHPDHPIKRYETFDDFSREMTDALTTYKPGGQQDGRGVSVTPLQRFFAGFIAKKDLAYYYQRFTEKRLDEPERVVALGPDPEWRAYYARKSLSELKAIASVIKHPVHTSRVAQQDPNLNIDAFWTKGMWLDLHLWDELYDGMRKRAFDDALSMAVPTARTDAASRDRRLAHLMNMGLFALNMVSMVIPPLGAVMAVVTAGQLLFEVLEGVTELSQGDREAGWIHIGDVLENVAQLAVGGAVLHVTLSPFIEGLKAVKLPTGKTRLWKPDLAPYAQDIGLPAGSLPDAEGLHTVDGRQVLPLEGREYSLAPAPEPGTYRIQHPLRADAYEPHIANNGSGAWLHEADQPLTWEGTPLMRRLGHAMDGLSDTQLEQVRRVSDVDESVLRRVHVESEPTPAIVLDTAQRFRAYDSAQGLSGQILAGPVPPELAGYSALLMVELPGWPGNQVIEVFEGTGPTRTTIHYGDLSRPDTHVLSINRSDLVNGRLAERVVATLTEEQLKGLLGQHLPDGNVLRSEQLQARLASHAKSNQLRVFESVYQGRQLPRSAEQLVMERDFKSLPAGIAQELLDGAGAKQRASLVDNQKIPQALAQQARLAQGQLRLARAYEGLYLDALANADTETLVLNSLERLPGWKDGLRLEVREESLTGPLRASYGEPAAAERKVLLRVEAGRYEVFDSGGNQLHGVDDLYGTLQHALTDAHRASIRLPHIGQGQQLRALIWQHALPRERLRWVLNMRPRSAPFFKPPRRHRGGRLGYPLSSSGGMLVRFPGFSLRFRELYPTADALEIEAVRATHFPHHEAWLRAQEQEFDTLEARLGRWRSEPIVGFGNEQSPAYQQQLEIRKELTGTLLRAWCKIGELDTDSLSDYQGQKIDLTGEAVGPQLASLPTLAANFDHVTYLAMTDSALTDGVDSFLTHFRGLRSLYLERNALTRVPLALEQMPTLRDLALSDNQIALDPSGSYRLKQLTRLRRLELNNNPLGMAPNISDMSHLYQLSLVNTGQTGWPIGVFSKPRPRWFNLDLADNDLLVPEVAPGSHRAQILSRTRVTRHRLNSEHLRRLKLYIESVGMDPDRAFAPRGVNDNWAWKTGLTDAQWVARQPTWDALEVSADAEPFFDVIRGMSEHLDDFDATPAVKPDLTGKVWRMLQAMEEDPVLRDRLFEIANRVEAIPELFNAMGLELMVWETLHSPPGTLIGIPMLNLAKGTVRLYELGIIIEERIQALLAQGHAFPDALNPGLDAAGNPLPEIDEASIYLAYTAGLAERLDLPWQTRATGYTVPGVTPQMLDDALTRVNAQGEGEGLRNAVVELGFWRDFVKRQNLTDFVAVENKFQALDRLERAMARWAKKQAELPESEKLLLRNVIRRSTIELDKPPGTFVPGARLGAAQFNALLDELYDEERVIVARLTDEALAAPIAPQ